ncbi:hypothetical protein Thivi_1020 [Thiocystis violascens DSM 198]|uniref:Uncharacterized protein n=2 Tax=Thiocystis violascens TaxID=73141 RepID=I3Y7T3_THIV6|nr:hypothetical protein Thivi_1020 [Thiocystis violascens DSM 198]
MLARFLRYLFREKSGCRSGRARIAMNIPAVILNVLAGAALMALLLLRWRQWRARRVSARASPRSPPANPRQVSMRPPTSNQDPHDPLTLELGVWRPPPRQQLMRRQAALYDELAGQPNERFTVASARRDPPPRIHTGFAPWIVEDSHPAPTEPPVFDQPPPQPIEGTRISRLGRKRQGLESLITDTPSVSEGHRHESNAR